MTPNSRAQVCGTGCHLGHQNKWHMVSDFWGHSVRGRQTTPQSLYRLVKGSVYSEG